MPNKSDNLNLNVFLESDVFDVNHVNENFDALDNLVVGKIFKNIQASYSGDGSNTTWSCIEYTKKIVTMMTKVEATNIKAETPKGIMYETAELTVFLPYVMQTILDVQIQPVGENIQIVTNTTSKVEMDRVKFKAGSFELEVTPQYKAFYIKVSGVIQ